ncbi:unnamed protein product, partial [Amoebophrya sp. A120]
GPLETDNQAVAGADPLLPPLSLAAGRITRSGAQKLRDTYEKLQTAPSPEDRRLVGQIGKTLQQFEASQQQHRAELQNLLFTTRDARQEGALRMQALLELDELGSNDSVVLRCRKFLSGGSVLFPPNKPASSTGGGASLLALFGDFVLQMANTIERSCLYLGEGAEHLSDDEATRTYFDERARTAANLEAQKVLEAALAEAPPGSAMASYAGLVL